MLMASTLTRASSRKTEGLTTRSSKRNTAILPGNNDLNIGRMQPPNIGRKKRPRDDGEEQEIQKKRAKIAIEITTTRPKKKAVTRSFVVSSDASSEPKHQKPTESKHYEKITTKVPQAPQLPAPAKKATKHHEKVVNGIKHELDRLKPVVGPGLDTGKLLKEEKRKLRSQEGTRFKSELSAYFPEYDEVIGNDPKEEHTLNLDTPIIIVDTAKLSTKHPSPRQHHDYPLKEFSESLFCELNDAQRVDFTFLDKSCKEDDSGEDPLSDEYFEKIHRRPERAEKTIRNTDRGRAQHEKDQVIRLLEGLQGPEWLKLMGVSGVTDSKKKEYEPAREHFIHGCETIIEKFRLWREEEKKRKLEKEAALAEAEEEDDLMEGVEGSQSEEAEEDATSDISDGDPPDYSDVDASAARQLHEEAIARSAPLSRAGRKAKMYPSIPNVEKDFTSFFAKRHMRAAALGNSRRSSRSVAALGHPVPEVDEADFELPEEFRDEEILKARERRKRRDRRVSKT